MEQRFPKAATRMSFRAGAFTISVILVLHAGAPASSLTFLHTPTANRSLDHSDHHHQSYCFTDSDGYGYGGRTGSDHSCSRWASPVCWRGGRQQRGSSSLFARLRDASLFGRSDARGGEYVGGGLGGGSSSNYGRGQGRERGRGRGRGGRRVADSDNTMKHSAAAASAGVFREEDPYVLEGVKNIRDLSSIEGYGIVPGRVFRTGHLSDATARDAKTLRDGTGLRTLIDLRSATELGKDKLVHGDVYEGFLNIGEGGHDGTGLWEGQAWDKTILGEDKDADALSRRRYFISLIDESIYKKGVFQRLRRRHKAAVMALAPATLVSRRCTQKARDIFMREINSGGLVLLNELLLQYSGEGISRVLRLLASKDRHPVALYCTAGKDRTGLVAALALAVLGVPDEAIVDDYAKSDAAYKELADRDAMVGALSQQDLDPDTFLGAPPGVMEEVLRFIRVKYGSIDDYLDSIGFDAEWRARLRGALLNE